MRSRVVVVRPKREEAFWDGKTPGEALMDWDRHYRNEKKSSI